MGSSSDLEVIQQVVPRKSTRTRRAARNIDELAPSAALQLHHQPPPTTLPQSLPELPSLPSSVPPLPLPLPTPSASSTTTPNPIQPQSQPQPQSIPLESQSQSQSQSSTKPTSSTTSTSSKPSSKTKSTKSTSTTKHLKKKPISSSKPIVVGGDSSDEAADFFNRTITSTKTTSRIPGGGGGGGGGGGRIPGQGRIPGRKPSTVVSRISVTPGVTTSPPKSSTTKTRKMIPSSDSSDQSDSDSSIPLQRPSSDRDDSSDDNDEGESFEPMTRDLNLPEWTKSNGAGAVGGRVGLSGADLKKLQSGNGKNRKRKRLGKEGSSSEEEEGEKEGSSPKRRKGKGKLEVDEFDLSDTDDSLEIEERTPQKKRASTLTPKKQQQNRPRRPGLILPSDDDDDDGDDIGRKNDLPTPQPKLPSPKKMTATEELLARARGLHNPTKSPAKRQTSSSTSNPNQITLNSSSDSEDPSSSTAFDLDPALAAIRAGTRKLSRAGIIDPDFEILERGTSTSTSTTLGGVRTNGSMSARGSGKVMVVVGMVFDPTMKMVNPTIKRYYETEEKFEIGINESFQTVFIQLSQRRYFNPNHLVLTLNKVEVYDFATPQSLRLAEGSTCHLKGYIRDVYEKVQKIERERIAAGGPVVESESKRNEEEEDDFSALEKAVGASSSLHPPAQGGTGRSRSPSATPGASAEPSLGGGSPDKNLFRLTIRGSKTQSIDLAVKLTTSIQSLIKAYSKQFGITDKARIGKMWIEIEGDKLDGKRTIEDVKEEFDLEGEETVDLRDPGA